MIDVKMKKNIIMQRRSQMLLKDNKGSAIVMVLVAIAFVSIMGSMVMYSTFYNYKMKVIDRSAKDSFYSADLAMAKAQSAQLRSTTALTRAPGSRIQPHAGGKRPGKPKKCQCATLPSDAIAETSSRPRRVRRSPRAKSMPERKYGIYCTTGK